MKILLQNGRVLDPASGLDKVCHLALAAGRIVGVDRQPADFTPNRVIDASGCLVLPGLVDLAARLREPGHEHEGMLESEMAAAVAGGVTSLVCPPDTDPVLDEPGLWRCSSSAPRSCTRRDCSRWARSRAAWPARC